MDLEAYHDRLHSAFSHQRARAAAFVEGFNANLPTAECPQCRAAGGHCPGLPCPVEGCGYIHPVSWALLQDGEWGAEVIALNNRHNVIARFDVEDVV